LSTGFRGTSFQLSLEGVSSLSWKLSLLRLPNLGAEQMSEDRFQLLLRTAIWITIVTGTVLLVLSVMAPNPVPPLYQRTYDAFWQIFSVGALGILGLVVSRIPSPPP
jgi:hypothetical protein